MVGILLMAENERECQILKMAFEQYQAKVERTAPSYSNYVKAMQYEPDIIIMEFPKMNTEQCYFASLLRKNKKSRKIPIIGYGDTVDTGIKRYISQKGVNIYIERPLKFSPLLKTVEKYLKAVNKSILSNVKNKTSEKESDVEQILDSKTLPTKKIELMVKHISNLLAFPFTVAKVLHLTESSSSGAKDLAKVIEADPVIAANILKMSNAVFFASRNRRISSIKDAIVRIGFNETKRIVMTVSVMEIFKKEDNNFGFNRMGFWLHSLSTAIISSLLAKNMNKVNIDEAFLSGLLHDFGILLLDEFFPTVFSKILEKTTNNGSRFVDNEYEILGITHNDIVKELFNKWNIPDTITEGICRHYTIYDKQDQIQSNEDSIALCIAMGNTISKSLCFGKNCDQYIVPLNKWMFDKIKMPYGLSDKVKEKINTEIKLYQRFLNIDTEERPFKLDLKKIGVVNSLTCVFSPAEEYFKAQGHTIIRIPESDSYNEFNRQFDAICIWAENDFLPQQLKPLTSIIKRCDRELDPTQEPPFIPVLAITDKDSSLISMESTKNLSFI
ncbi:MAG: HDOD domain-containing protein, partial [Chitinispirillia bacterium]